MTYSRIVSWSLRFLSPTSGRRPAQLGTNGSGAAKVSSVPLDRCLWLFYVAAAAVASMETPANLLEEKLGYPTLLILEEGRHAHSRILEVLGTISTRPLASERGCRTEESLGALVPGMVAPEIPEADDPGMRSLWTLLWGCHQPCWACKLIRYSLLWIGTLKWPSSLRYPSRLTQPSWPNSSTTKSSSSLEPQMGLCQIEAYCLPVSFGQSCATRPESNSGYRLRFGPRPMGKRSG